jgi:hypothetical protein
MKKILASTFLFLLLQLSSFLDGVFACDKQTDNDTVCWAVAVTREVHGGRNLVGELKKII